MSIPITFKRPGLSDGDNFKYGKEVEINTVDEFKPSTRGERSGTSTVQQKCPLSFKTRGVWSSQRRL